MPSVELFVAIFVVGVALSVSYSVLHTAYENAERKVREARARYIDEECERLKNLEHYDPEPRMNPYAILGVPSTATQDEIKTAYRRLAMKHHPDRGGALEEFQRIQDAYERLMKPARCPECGGKGTIKVKRGAFIDTIKCPRCWPT